MERPRSISPFIMCPISIMLVRPHTIPLSLNKEKYVQLLRDPSCKVLISRGPPGSAKTHLAVKEAIAQVCQNRYKKAVFCKPLTLIEDSESIGYLPGDQNSKLKIYFDHIIDMIKDVLTISKYNSLFESNMFEFVPLVSFVERHLKTLL